MDQYYIGINKASEKISKHLTDLGASVVCKWLPQIEKFNKKYNFYEGEWFLVMCSTDETEVNDVRNFLFGECEFDKELKFEVIFIRG